MSDLRISVLMPVFNSERYLAEAVESILAQTYDDFEFLIVDDGSSDGSLAILRDYAARDGRIRLISRANTGYVVALNEMIELARGEFMARMDADDVSLPDRFARQVDYLSAHPEVLAVGGRILAVGPDGEPLMTMCDKFTHEEIDAYHMSGGLASICHPASMIRSDAMRAVGGYRQEYYTVEDVDLWLRLAEIGRLGNLPQVLLEYRQHAASIGHARFEEQRERVREVVADACRRRGLPEPGFPTAVAEKPPGELDHFRKWAWWALTEGHVEVSRKYAKAVIRRAPFDPNSWRLAYCSLRGR